MTRLRLALATLLFFAAACGQSGPLYLPGNPSEVREPPAASAEDDEEIQKPQNDN